jgi:hypothetical protein
MKAQIFLNIEPRLALLEAEAEDILNFRNVGNYVLIQNHSITSRKT